MKKNASKVKYDREWSKNVLKNFQKNYARATELLRRYYGLTEQKEIFIVQIGGNIFYKYKKCVKLTSKLIQNYTNIEEIPYELMNSCLRATEFVQFLESGLV